MAAGAPEIKLQIFTVFLVYKIKLFLEKYVIRLLYVFVKNEDFFAFLQFIRKIRKITGGFLQCIALNLFIKLNS